VDGTNSYADPNSKHYQSKDQEYDGASPCKLGSNTRNLHAVRTPGQGMEVVEEEGAVTVSTGNSAHSRHIGPWHLVWDCWGGGQVYNPFTVGSWA